MPKAAAVGTVPVPNVATPFIANVPPDPFDARDLMYRPRLQLLDDAVDRRSNAVVLTQKGNSCTGHAVAAMIDTVFAQKPLAANAQPIRVSPYMLYYLARRYDEFPGDEDAGSSLRGVLKGWWRHGVALESDWKDLRTHLDLDDANLVASCRLRPLGAYYRVDPQRLDDMQSAITELHAIVASGQVHDGWVNPQPETKNGQTNYVIRKTPNAAPLGGHAFALVGYNDVGFLVQNSWGTTWGKGGFATLPYEDWLESAYDAWVARPGVPQTPFARFDRVVTADGVIGVSAVPSPDVIRKHVLNLGNDGKLSTNGQATSSPAQLGDLIAEMTAKHDAWGSTKTVIYIHGGLVAESSGLAQVQEQFQWWLNNHVYPIFIVWQSGPMETVLDQLQDKFKQLPFGAGIIQEGIDRLIEKTASTALAFAWAEMKENALKASGKLDALPANPADWFKKPGASLLLRLLKDYKASHSLELHVVAHSAGAVFVEGLVPRLEEYGIPVESLTFMAGASTVDAFDKGIVPRLSNQVKRIANFTMTDALELDDTCLKIYHKSLLYLVSRGFERPKKREVPLVGMEHFFDTRLSSGETLRQTIQTSGSIIESSGSMPNPNVPDDSKCTAEHHGAFHDDIPTMTAVLMHILGQPNVTNPRQRYSPNAPAIAPAALAMTAEGRMHIAKVERRAKERKASPQKTRPRSERRKER
jgi:hypothetical protein